jgi:hypothetical protein
MFGHSWAEDHTVLLTSEAIDWVEQDVQGPYARWWGEHDGWSHLGNSSCKPPCPVFLYVLAILSSYYQTNIFVDNLLGWLNLLMEETIHRTLAFIGPVIVVMLLDGSVPIT